MLILSTELTKGERSIQGLQMCKEGMSRSMVFRIFQRKPVRRSLGVSTFPDSVTTQFPTKEKGQTGLHDRFVAEGRQHSIRLASDSDNKQYRVNFSPVGDAWERSHWW